MNLLKNILPVSINGQPNLKPPTLPRNQAVNPIPIDNLTEPKHFQSLFTNLLLFVLLSLQMSQYTVHCRLELPQPLCQQLLFGNQPLLPIQEPVAHDERVRPSKLFRDLINLFRRALQLLAPSLHFLSIDQSTHAVGEQSLETVLELVDIGGDGDIAYEPRLETMSAIEPQVPEIDGCFQSIVPLREKQASGDGAGAQDFGILRRRLALGDQGFDVGVDEAAVVGAELDGKIGTVGRGSWPRRTAESVVRRKIGAVVGVRGLRWPGIERRVGSKRVVRRWGSPEGGIGRVGLLHGIENEGRTLESSAERLKERENSQKLDGDKHEAEGLACC